MDYVKISRTQRDRAYPDIREEDHLFLNPGWKAVRKKPGNIPVNVAGNYWLITNTLRD
jgi:hypothetical protein